MRAEIERYLEGAVRFAPTGARPLRVAHTLLTCGVAVALLNELRLPEESGPVYRYLNVHNPRQALRFERGAWACPAELAHHPLWGINWAGAALLCQALGARLPSEQEWERFASNGDPARRYPWGDAEPSPLRANYDEHCGGPSAVASFPPSELGLYDLAGNLSEWCEDTFEAGGGGLERVAKGGAWSKGAQHLEIHARRGKWQRLVNTTIGLRPVW